MVRTKDKEMISVFIKNNESHLQQAITLLEKHGQKMDDYSFNLNQDIDNHYLKYSGKDGDWYIGAIPRDKVITLSELETILKSE